MEILETTHKVALKNVLFATDFEAAAQRAMPYARMFAEHYSAKLYAAHVIPLAAFATARYESVEVILRESRDYARNALQQIIDPLRHGSLRCETFLAEGEVVEELEACAQQFSADLIVVGSTSRSGLGKIVLGSVAEEVIRNAMCPVLTVGPHVLTEEKLAVRSIICAIDFSAGSRLATEYALSLAHDFQANLSLVHVLTSVLADRPQSVSAVEDQMRKMIPPDCDLSHAPSVLVETGAVPERIVRGATELKADLIVMGVRGAGAFAHAASHLGSIAHTVISSSHCPVMTVGHLGNVSS